MPARKGGPTGARRYTSWTFGSARAGTPQPRPPLSDTKHERGKLARRRPSSHPYSSHQLSTTYRSPRPLVPQVHQTLAADTVANGRHQERIGREGARQEEAFPTGAHVFSGPSGRTDGVRAFGALRGLNIEDLDLLGGHDLSHPSVCGELLSRAWRAELGAVLIGPPCSSYSPALRASGLQLRSRKHPKGRHDAPPGWRAYIRRHNGFGNLAIQLAWAQHHTGGGWAIEQPADTGRKGTPWYWPFAADGGSLWLWPEIEGLQRQTGAVWLTFAQCMLGAQGRKYTTILASQSMARHLTHLHGLCCPGSGWHTKHVRAFGSDEFGGSRAARAAAYPPSLNRLLAGAMALAAAAQRAGRAAWRIGRHLRQSQEWADGLLARMGHEALQAGTTPTGSALLTPDLDSGSESGDSVSDGSSSDDGDDLPGQKEDMAGAMAHGQFSAQQRTEGRGPGSRWPRLDGRRPAGMRAGGHRPRRLCITAKQAGSRSG